MILRLFPTIIIGSALFAVSACGTDEAPSGETDTETDSDSASDSDSTQEGPCVSFHDYAMECDIEGQNLMILDLMCSTIDSLFIDSFLHDMLACFTAGTCEDFIALLESGAETADAGPSDGDAGAPDDPFSMCTAAALLTAEPEPANEEFQENFCAWAMQCNGELSEIECNLYFADPDGMLLFTVLDEPYISDANDCVDPMPSCTEDVGACLDAVTDDISQVLEIFSSF